MAQGTIKTLQSERGFGFIQPDGGGQDLFFHIGTLLSSDVAVQWVAEPEPIKQGL